MRLTLKKYPDGRLRPYWFGEFQRNGRRKVVTLARWRGTPPSSQSVSDLGDPVFESSRAAATTALRDLIEGQQSHADKEVLVQRIHSARYGAKVRQVLLRDLTDQWDHLPRRRKSTAAHRDNCHRTIRRFVAYVAETDASIQELGAVTAAHVQGFMDAENARGVSPRTWNISLTILRALFRRLEPFSEAWRDYLAITPAREEQAIHREPYSGEEIAALVGAAQADPLIQSLMVTALCTAMRRGDVCNLRWRHVDLKGGFITVKTAKTGGTVDIPIFPRLRDELERATPRGKPDPNAFVFPEAARLHVHSPDALDRRLKTVLHRAGYVDEKVIARKEKAPTLASRPTSEVLSRGLEAMDATPMTAHRRARMKRILELYLGGSTVREIAEAMASSKGIVSMRLQEVEQMTGLAVIRRPPEPEIIRGYTLTSKDPDTPRLKRGSLKGWHAFRTTWITLALSAGVPMELVRRVTGHGSVDIVLKHYFRPGREQFRTALQSAMPSFMLDGPRDAVTDALAILHSMTSKSWKEDRDRVVNILQLNHRACGIQT